MPALVRFEIDAQEARVASVTLCDAARRNALSTAMFADFTHSLDELQSTTPQPTVLILRSEGAHFCSGFDLAAIVQAPLLAIELLASLSHIIRRLKRLDAIVIAEVRGAALAGGCALLTACDFVVAAPDAQLGYPTHRIGISPAVSIPSLLPKTRGATRSLLVSNDIVSGTRAHALGLVTHVADDPHTAANALATQLLCKEPVALRATKRYFNTLENTDENAVFDAALHASAQLAHGEEFTRMLTAFWAAKS